MKRMGLADSPTTQYSLRIQDEKLEDFGPLNAGSLRSLQRAPIERDAR